MKVSFLVTYYNQEQYVRQSLDSILAIYKPFEWEILVGDDGSSDNTVNIVNEYIKKYPDNISLYIMPRDNNIKYEIVKRSSANRLNLLTKMTGNYFCVLDGDDYYCNTDFVVDSLKLFKEYTDISIVAFGYQRVLDGKKIISDHCLSIGKINTNIYLKNGLYIPAGACVFKNNIDENRMMLLQEVGYYDDNDIVCNNLYFGDMYAIDKVIYSYRQIESSTYNSMKLAEQSILNLQGYDVDVLYLPNYKKALLERNISPLLNVFFLKSKIKNLIEEDKFNRYFESCKNINNSITYKLLNYNNLTISEKKELIHIIAICMFKKPRLSLKIIIKNILF